MAHTNTVDSPPSLLHADERRERPRRVNALLNAYYSIEDITQNETPQEHVSSDLDRQGFDAKRYFDTMVFAGKLPDLVKRSRDLDVEVKQLDCEMQKLVYDNYTHFTRAAGVISKMKVCIEALAPDIQQLEGNISRMTTHEDQAEVGVAERSKQLDAALKQQRICQKLDMLFRLPAMLKRCLDQGSYESAAAAYNSCSVFLSRHEHMPTFKSISDDVEYLVALIRHALVDRLHSIDLSVDDAVQNSATLLSLGESPATVMREYLVGRTAILQQLLHDCFQPEATSTSSDQGDGVGVGLESSGIAGADATTIAMEASTSSSRYTQEMQRPESKIVSHASTRAASQYIPSFCDAVDGFQTIHDSIATPRRSMIDETALAGFVSTQMEELFEQMSALVRQRCPPTRVLVSCVHNLHDALLRLQARLPQLTSELFLQFRVRLSNNAVDTLFAAAASATLHDLARLHDECGRVEESDDSDLTGVFEDIARTEKSLIMNGWIALSECQPLLSLVDIDLGAAQQLVRRLHGQLISFFLAFVDVCHTYIGQDPEEVRNAIAALLGVSRLAPAEIDSFAQLTWRGLYGLILVRMGRHLEVKVIGKVWGAARDMFTSCAAATDLVPHPELIKATRNAAQAVITHYSFIGGQRLAHFFRDSIQGCDWSSSGEPSDTHFLARVVKDMRRWDTQLARILGDPRKDRDAERRPLNLWKNSMELEMERLLVKKLQAFVRTPFNRNGVEVGILRIAFKALTEYVREATFSKFGLQQIQVDCALLSTFVQGFTEDDDATILCSLLNEVVVSASQRCDNPAFMDAALVEALCEEKKKEFDLE